jgi:hypothetical protein
MKVLVVDDEQDMLVLFQQRSAGTYGSKVELAFAFSGEEAIRCLNQSN